MATVCGFLPPPIFEPEPQNSWKPGIYRYGKQGGKDKDAIIKAVIVNPKPGRIA